MGNQTLRAYYNIKSYSVVEATSNVCSTGAKGPALRANPGRDRQVLEEVTRQKASRVSQTEATGWER